MRQTSLELQSDIAKWCAKQGVTRVIIIRIKRHYRCFLDRFGEEARGAVETIKVNDAGRLHP